MPIQTEPLDSTIVPAYTFAIPLEATLSLNQLLKLHYRQKTAYRNGMRELLVALLLEEYPALRDQFPSIGKAHLEFIRYAPKALDWDNFLGGMKPVVDCLTAFHKTRNPSGLGLIAADDPDHIPSAPSLFQFKSDANTVRVNIYRYEQVAD